MRNLGPEIWVTLGLVLDIHILYGISTFDSHSESFELELNGIPRLVVRVEMRVRGPVPRSGMHRHACE